MTSEPTSTSNTPFAQISLVMSNCLNKTNLTRRPVTAGISYGFKMGANFLGFKH